MGEHLFISYATEDAPLADWLTLKLTAAGYKVWCDRFQLLGGERFPRDIDRAIKNDTFRLLALISKVSLEKENPTKERTLALSIGKERKVDFLIPLKVEPLSATDLNWMISDITYIPFDQGWAPGLAQLFKKLDSIKAPKPLSNGSNIAANSVLQEEFITTNIERLHTNAIEVLRIPDVIHRFDVRRRVSPADEDVISATWPAYLIDDSTYLSFWSPPSDLQAKLDIRRAGGKLWRDADDIDGVFSLNIVSNLLKKCVQIGCLQKGLKLHAEAGLLYFPSGLIKNNRLKFASYDADKTHVLTVGQRKKTGSKYRYHLAPTFDVRRNMIGKFCILLKIRLLITDTAGVLLPPRQALSRRKHLCKNWWNDHWFKRAMAIMSYLADGQEVIKYGNEDENVILSSKFVQYQVGFGIDEVRLSKKRTEEEVVFLEEAEEEASADEESGEVPLDE